MIFGLALLKNRIDTLAAESFDGTGSNEYSKAFTTLLLIVLFFILYMIIYAYGAARLSYFYNMNNGSPGFAIFFSILAFIFADFYYPMYSYFLNPQSAKGRNNISLPANISLPTM